MAQPRTHPLRPARPGTRRPAEELSWRVLGGLNLYRIAVAAGLLTLFLASGPPAAVGHLYPPLFQWGAMAYLAFASLNTLFLWLRRPPVFAQLCIHLAGDVAAITTLMHASGGVGSGVGLLLVVPVAVAALVATARIALLFAAVAALAVLMEQTWSRLQEVTAPADFIAAGLLGAMLFLVAVAVYPYARRLAESEALAERQSIDLHNLSQLSEYIIQQLRESIVVVDGEDVVRLANESAAGHLGAPGLRPGRALATVHPQLHGIVQRWRRGDLPQDPPPLLSADGDSEIVPRIAPMGPTRDGALLVFLEDSGYIAERVQQMKLASLGRLSASIAHEIRNPVGAMSHAGQLLAESPNISSEERRLTDIVADNAVRVSRIIDSVLTMSRRTRSRPQSLALPRWLREFADEYRNTHELPATAVRILGGDNGVIHVRMDPTHLRQILHNLCDNALRYAHTSTDKGLIELTIGRLASTRRPYLEVADRGPGIAPALLEEIFEPFVASENGGTGLGLYIARELCESNGAGLHYRARPGGGSVFRLVFADSARWEISAARTAVNA